MIKFFRHIRRSLLNENLMGKPTSAKATAGRPASPVGRYFKYAIGEILLVVIGILIALQINNWNEEQGRNKKLISIYKSVYADINNDLKDLNDLKAFYMGKKPVFEKVVKDSITSDLLDQGLSRLLGTGWNITLNKSGINQLKELDTKDSLALKAINIYDLLEVELISREENFNEVVIEHSKYVRDNYNWYPEWISKTIMKENSSPELQDYFINGNDYRNRVIYAYQQLYNGGNYIPTTNRFIAQLTELEVDVEKFLQSVND